MAVIIRKEVMFGDNQTLLKSYEPIKTSQLNSIIDDLNLNISDNLLDSFILSTKIYLDNLFINRFGCSRDLIEILVNICKIYEKNGKRIVLIFPFFS